MWGGGSAGVQFAAQQLQPSLRVVPVVRAAAITMPALCECGWVAELCDRGWAVQQVHAWKHVLVMWQRILALCWSLSCSCVCLVRPSRDDACAQRAFWAERG